MAAKGTVTVRVRLRDGAMEFVVLDEGPGVTCQMGDTKLFEKFWRGENTAHRRSCPASAYPSSRVSPA